MTLLSPPLQAFFEIARNQTVHAAARGLGITQTGVTQRLRTLESQLGASLFIRSRRGMKLTQEGEALLRYCQAALELEGETLSRIHGAGTRAQVRVVLTGPTSLIRSRIVPACVPVLKSHPELLFDFRISDIENRDEDLRTGRAQLAILPREQVAREMDSKLLKPERYVLVAPPSWKSRPLAEIVRDERIIDFDSTDQMSLGYLRKFKLLELARTERNFVNSTESVAQLIRGGVGYGVLTVEFARPLLDRGELITLNSGRVRENELALAWFPRPAMPSYLKALIQAIR